MRNERSHFAFIGILAFLMGLGATFLAKANPMVLSEESLAVVPRYLWAGIFIILLLEAAGVAAILRWRACRFWRSFGALVIVNVLLYVAFSKWLIIADRYGSGVMGSGGLVAEGVIVAVEAVCIYFLMRSARFATPRCTPFDGTCTFILSFGANAISMILGLLMSTWAHEYLYRIIDNGGV